MRAAHRCDAAAGRVCSEDQAAEISGPGVGRSRARHRSVLLQEERKEAGRGHAATPQRLRRTHKRLVQHSEGAPHR